MARERRVARSFQIPESIWNAFVSLVPKEKASKIRGAQVLTVTAAITSWMYREVDDAKNWLTWVGQAMAREVHNTKSVLELIDEIVEQSQPAEDDQQPQSALPPPPHTAEAIPVDPQPQQLHSVEPLPIKDPVIGTQWTLPAPASAPCGPAVYTFDDIKAALPANEATIKTWIRQKILPRPANYESKPRTWFWPQQVWNAWADNKAKKASET